VTAHPPILEARNISVLFEGAGNKQLEILREINLKVQPHEILAFLGPSGCGKSTLIRSLIGLQKPTSGNVFYKGAHFSGVNPSAGLVFQNFALFPWLTVQQNVELGASHLRLPTRQLLERVENVINLVGLQGFEDAYPRELSGGMKQRVGLARALVVEPEILCLDEPFSALDVLTSETLRNEIVDLYLSADSPVDTILTVTHSVSEAVFMATRIVVLAAHPGTIRTILENPLPYPRDEHSPEFIRLTQKLHAILTQTYLPDEASPQVAAAKAAAETIPNATVGSTIGLLEILENEGEMDLFNLTRFVDQDFAHLLLIVKTAELLGWITTPGQRVQMTAEGRRFLAAPVPERKKLLNQALRHIRVFQIILAMINNAEAHELAEEDALTQLAMTYPHERPVQMLRLVIGWGRYAELFKFSSTRKIFYFAHDSTHSA
jgi:NitT/TauT family transport system ATP-binding protein